MLRNQGFLSWLVAAAAALLIAGCGDDGSTTPDDGGGTADTGPGGDEDAGPGGDEDAGPGGDEDAGPGGDEDAGPGGDDGGPGGDDGGPGGDDGGPGGDGGETAAPTITMVEWEQEEGCTNGESSDVLITVTVDDPDTATEMLTFDGSVTGCTPGDIDGPVSTITCPQVAPYAGSVTVTDPEDNSDMASFTVPVCEDGSESFE